MSLLGLFFLILSNCSMPDPMNLLRFLFSDEDEAFNLEFVSSFRFAVLDSFLPRGISGISLCCVGKDISPRVLRLDEGTSTHSDRMFGPEPRVLQ